MRIISKIALYVLGIMVFLSVPSLYASQKGKIVFGGSFGSPNLANTELSGIDRYVYGSEFLEWYFSDNVALGIRDHKFYKNTGGDYFVMANLNLSLTWRFWELSQSMALAAYGAYGPGLITRTNAGEGIDYSGFDRGTTSYGLLLDWGGTSWGLRLGYHSVSAGYEYVDGGSVTSIDSSFSSLNVGIRYAF